MPLVTKPKRGDVVRARLNPIEGSEQAGERPVLVLSPDYLNELCPTVIVACITSKKTDKIFRNEVLLPASEGGLRMRSKVMLSQVRTLDKVRFVAKYGAVSPAIMDQVDKAILISMGLVKL